eukprot:CFRG0296T1
MEVKHQYLSNLQQNQLGFFALQVALGQIMVVHNQTEKVLALLECLAIPDSSFRVSLALQIVITKMNNPQADHRWEVQRLYNSRDQHVKHTDIQHAISCEKLQVPQESQEILIQEHNLPSRKTSSNQQSGDNVGRQSAYIFSTNSHHVPSDSTPCARQTNHNYNFETFFNSLQSSIERKVTRTGSSMTSSQQPDSAKNDDSGNVDNNNTQRPFGLGLGLLSNFVNNSTQFPFESGLGLRNSIANKSIQPLFELRGGTRNCLPDFKCGNGRKSGFDWGEPYIEKLVEPKPKEPGGSLQVLEPGRTNVRTPCQEHVSGYDFCMKCPPIWPGIFLPETLCSQVAQPRRAHHEVPRSLQNKIAAQTIRDKVKAYTIYLSEVANSVTQDNLARQKRVDMAKMENKRLSEMLIILRITKNSTQMGTLR